MEEPVVSVSQPKGSNIRDGLLRISRLAATIFSFPVMCMSLLTAVLLRYSVRGFPESDIWWHLRNASALLRNHRFAPVDSYSFTAAGTPWISFEWLSELPFLVGFRSMGLQGLLLVYFAVLVLIFIGVYYRCWRGGADCKDAAVATLGAICLGGVSMAPRTLLFGWLCMVSLLLILDYFKRTGNGLWLLLPLFALWINLHGSWIFGVFVIAVTIMSGLVEGEWGQIVANRWNGRQLRYLVLVLVGVVAVLFVNPFGYKLVQYPFDLLRKQGVMVQYMEEWQPVDFGTWNGKLAMVLTFGVIASALLSRRKWKLDEAILTAFALWAALSHVRFMFFAGLIIMPILAPRLKLFMPYQRELDKPWLNAAIIATTIAAMISFFPSETNLNRRIEAEYPKAALDFMEGQHIRGRVFNQYKFGGYMEWHAPEIRPFIDGRADLFVYNGVFKDFIKATALDNSLEILDRYKVDYVLFVPNEPLTYLLEHSQSWRLIYSDSSTVLFGRAGVGATPSG